MNIQNTEEALAKLKYAFPNATGYELHIYTNWFKSGIERFAVGLDNPPNTAYGFTWEEAITNLINELADAEAIRIKRIATLQSELAELEAKAV